MKKNACLVIEITETWIRLFYARHRGQQRVLHALRFARLSSDVFADISGFLKKQRALFPGTPPEAVLVLPRKWVMLKTFRLPAHQEAEIQAMLILQLPARIPYSLQEVVYSYTVLARNPDGYAHVLVALAPKDRVHKYWACLQEAGIRTRGLAVSSWGLSGWLAFQQTVSGAWPSEALSMLISVGMDETEICFATCAQVFYSRSVAFTAADIGPKTAFLIRQADLSLKSFRGQQENPPVARVHLLCFHAQARDLVSALERALAVPVTQSSSLENIPCQAKLDVPARHTRAGASLAVGLGFLFARLETEIDLTPPEVLTQAAQKHRQRSRLFFVLLLVAAVGLAGGVGQRRNAVKAAQVKVLDQQVSRLKPGIEAFERKRALINAFSQHRQERLFIPELVYRVHQLIPRRMGLKQFYVSSGGEVILVGDALSGPLLQAFQKGLLSEKDFFGVTLHFATQRTVYQQTRTHFKIGFKVAKDLFKERKDEKWASK